MRLPYRVRLLRSARRDLVAIFDHISLSSPQNAAEVFLGLSAEIDALGTLPIRHKVFRDSPHAARVVRGMSRPPHIVYYRVQERAREIVILMVRHGARLTPKRFPSK